MHAAKLLTDVTVYRFYTKELHPYIALQILMRSLPVNQILAMLYTIWMQIGNLFPHPLFNRSYRRTEI